MPISFPTSPITGQQYTYEGVKREWDGAAWVIVIEEAEVGDIEIANVIGLQTALDGKASLTHTHAITDITGLQTALDEKAVATRTISSGTGLTGGGDLTINRTIALSSGSIASLALANSAVQPARTLTAGNGLTGGGDLSANRSFVLGTPSTLTASTTNTVTSTSHTHAITGFLPLTGGTLTGTLTIGGSAATHSIEIGKAGNQQMALFSDVDASWIFGSNNSGSTGGTMYIAGFGGNLDTLGIAADNTQFYGGVKVGITATDDFEVGIPAARRIRMVNDSNYSYVQASGVGTATGGKFQFGGYLGNTLDELIFNSASITFNGPVVARTSHFSTTSNQTIGTNHYNRIIELTGTTGRTMTLPNGGTSVAGDTIVFLNSSSANMTVAVASGGTLYRGGVAGSFVVSSNQMVSVVRGNTSGTWYA